jgi:hypothetical protein
LRRRGSQLRHGGVVPLQFVGPHHSKLTAGSALALSRDEPEDSPSTVKCIALQHRAAHQKDGDQGHLLSACTLHKQSTQRQQNALLQRAVVGRSLSPGSGGDTLMQPSFCLLRMTSTQLERLCIQASTHRPEGIEGMSLPSISACDGRAKRPLRGRPHGISMPN